MLRIHRSQTRRGTVMRAEGRLVAETLVELEGSLREALAAPAQLTLDLSGVSYLDRRGADLLRDLARRGVLLEGGSPFVRTLLEDHR